MKEEEERNRFYLLKIMNGEFESLKKDSKKEDIISISVNNFRFFDGLKLFIAFFNGYDWKLD